MPSLMTPHLLVSPLIRAWAVAFICAKSACGGIGGTSVRLELPPRRLARGSYRLTLRLTAPINPGPPRLFFGPAFRVP